MKVVKQIQRNYTRREPKSDYLKWWRIIRRYTMIRYNLSTADLEMLLYLYSEGLFTYWDFQEYANAFGWDRHRFTRLKEDGWLHCWKEKHRGDHRLYEITRHGRHVCTNMYKMLNYEMEIPESTSKNPIMKKRTYSDKVLVLSIKKFNEEVRKQNPHKRITF
jgi:hypothetical protein